MKRLTVVFLFLALALTGCDAWVIRPAPYQIPTPFFTRTPSIYSPTPIILAPPFTATFTPVAPTVSQVVSPTFTDTPITPTISTPTDGSPNPSVQISVKVLGCNTSIDITHGMGEVTNAYVTIQNIGTADLKNVCATLH
ncbi:MAG: hypothetical protein HY258_00575, partial [Chloroflexi bacterium]|nr:hypothetical protein [Chloroflexota bacterium]